MLKMKQNTLLAVISLATFSVACDEKPVLTSQGLQDAVTVEALMGHCQDFQDFADASENANRHISSDAHNATVQYVYDQISALSDYWDVELQTFNTTIQIYGLAKLEVDGAAVNISVLENSPSGTFEGLELVMVDNIGCEQADYPETLAGKIALISRGECTYSSKSARAGVAGAVGAVIYNNKDGAVSGTLGGADEIGEHIPTGGISKEAGLALVEMIESSEEAVSVDFMAEIKVENVFTSNVIATSKGGNVDDTLFIGAHSDSVYAGPGINDNGSGSASLLAIAKALTMFAAPSSRIRLAWWSAEEHGLLGSKYYVTTASSEALQQVRLYLNFDMIASPNYVLAVYDGSGATFNLTGPAGSGEAQTLFEEFFADQGYASIPAEFSGRSDYGPFLDVGVPCGGLFTGAEQLKTETEAELFGGQAGVALDANYHQAGDDLSNLNEEAFEINAKAIAHAVATYGNSFEGFPEREPMSDGPVRVTSRSHVHSDEPAKRDDSRHGVSMSCGGHEGEAF